MMRFVAAASIAALVVYSPVFNNYGLSFFTFYEHFPIPGFSKNFYKGVIAVWGLPMLFAAVPLVWFQMRDTSGNEIYGQKKLWLFCLIAIVPVILLFLRVPLKSAFMIPLVPFVVMASALFFNKSRLRLLLLSAVISCFMFGINLDDAQRGSAKSEAGIAFKVSNQPVVFDPFQGLLTADRSKRIQRTAFAREVLHSASSIQKPAAVIAGWWLADILVLEKEGSTSGIEWLYYTDETRLKELQSQHIQLYYLPQQDAFNDLRFDKVFTHEYVQPFPLVP
jgi:hypothetical protein